MTEQYEIPPQLYGFRFIKVAARGKNAIEKDWPTKNYSHDDPELIRHIRAAGNYGVIAGENHVLIDTDTPELQELVQTLIEEPTFTVRSPGHGTLQFYLQVDAPTMKTKPLGGKVNVGHLKVGNSYLVGPGCVHPNGGRYEVQHDVEILRITREHFDRIIHGLAPFIANLSSQEERVQFNGSSTLGTFDWNRIVNLSKLRRTGAQYQGSHPVHGSTTGLNFTVNPDRGVWYCFRCCSGGGPLQLLAVIEGLISCGEAQPSVLRGELFKQVRDLAIEKGALIPIKNHSSPVDSVKVENFFSRDPHGNSTFEPVRFGSYLMGKYQFKAMDDNYDVFVFDPEAGIWRDYGAQIIRMEMGNVLGEENRNRHIIDVKHAIVCKTMTKRPIPPKNKLALLNGVVNLETGKLEPANPNDFIIIQIPVRYDENAMCPKIDQFLNEVHENPALLIDVIAYCLWLGMPIQQAIFIFGPAETGKSTYIEFVHRFLGKENTSSLTLQTICTNRFAPAELYNKLANLSADLPSAALVTTGMFKCLTGGDRISAEKKGRNPFYFNNFSKQIYSANEVPDTKDDTEAFYRRWLMVEFLRKFVGAERDPNILDKICTPSEFSGLLNKAMKALPALLQRNAFNEETTEQTRKKMIMRGNSARAFIEERLETTLSPDDHIDKDLLFREYAQYCAERELKTGKPGELTTQIRQHLSAAELTKRRPTAEEGGDKLIRTWEYLKWKTSPGNTKQPTGPMDAYTEEQ